MPHPSLFHVKHRGLDMNTGLRHNVAFRYASESWPYKAVFWSPGYTIWLQEMEKFWRSDRKVPYTPEDMFRRHIRSENEWKELWRAVR